MIEKPAKSIFTAAITVTKKSIEKHDMVSFCVLSDVKTVEGEWGLDFQSVIVYGRMKVVRDMDTIKTIARMLSLKFT